MRKLRCRERLFNPRPLTLVLFISGECDTFCPRDGSYLATAIRAFQENSRKNHHNSSRSVSQFDFYHDSNRFLLKAKTFIHAMAGEHIFNIAREILCVTTYPSRFSPRLLLYDSKQPFLAVFSHIEKHTG